MITQDGIAGLIEFAMAHSPRTQKEIAAIVGVRQSFLSMIKSGKAKIPIDRAPALAVALDLDPAGFLTLCLEAYEPKLLAALRSVYPELAPERDANAPVPRSVRKLGPRTRGKPGRSG